ncbi:MAG: winged helix-turn-helix transcriptional regulator [Chlorobi bacterium]|nr:winged helix-turn-helix transcriptional regulator [Chlorobiota bacterium]
MKDDETCEVLVVDKAKVNHAREELEKVDIEKMAEFYKAFSDTTRLQIIMALTVEELCVCDLATVAGVSISAVSHQLRYLRNLSVVHKRKTGRKVYYSLRDEHISTILNTVKEHLDET